MANLMLKKTILEVVDNQLRNNDLPAAKQAYQKLLDAGYSSKEAKEKIGAVVLTEIYDVLKEKKGYDDERYRNSLEEMVQQCIDFEDTHEIPTEWEEWDELVQRGYEAEAAMDMDLLLECWWKAWEIFQKIVEQKKGTCSVSGLMEEQDYQYPIDEWLQDLEMDLGNMGEHNKRLSFCHKVLEMLDWSYDDGSNFRSAIGEELFQSGKEEEGRRWFENWLKEEPHNENAWCVFSLCVEGQEGAESAYKLIRREVIGIPCTMDNHLLFLRARSLAEHLKLAKDLEWIETQLASFSSSIEEADHYNEMYDDFLLPKQKPIVKEQKIYPNDPCPCGSGKKYKKCCGKK